AETENLAMTSVCTSSLSCCRVASGVAACAVLMAMCGSARAVGLASEGFMYPAGTPLPAMGGGPGWAGPWIGSGMMVATPPTLTYPLALPPVGLALRNTSVGEGWRDFAAPIRRW